MLRRYQRINVDKHWLDRSTAEIGLVASTDVANPPSMLGHNLSGQTFWLFHFAASYYLEDDLKKSRDWGRRLVESVENYFFGDWRQHMPNNPERPQDDVSGYYASGGGGWLTEYRTSMAFAMALDSWDAATRLSTHPSEGKSDASMCQKEKSWLLLLAEYVRAGLSESYESQLFAIRHGTAKAPKVCAECLNAIAENRTEEIDQRFAEQMKYYLRNQKKRDELEYKLALDGTFLYHMARQRGHEIPMDKFTRDHLIIFEQSRN